MIWRGEEDSKRMHTGVQLNFRFVYGRDVDASRKKKGREKSDTLGSKNFDITYLNKKENRYSIMQKRHRQEQ